MQTKSCPGYSNNTASSRILLPDGNNNARPSDVYRKPSTKPPRTRPKVESLNLSAPQSERADTCLRATKQNCDMRRFHTPTDQVPSGVERESFPSVSLNL